ncbi:MAG: 2-oxoacid:acceptor oxidoreductase subunit alpha, partial [Cellvibrionaceae bacterium]|nr:2-oxoacid:acceptor oxidoreductase subunit alpha [Cellvibrionaceae bacterium]
NMQRLLHKWETAKDLVPAPEIITQVGGQSLGLIHFGTSKDATLEAVELLAAEGIAADSCRIRAFPFNKEVEDFIAEHDSVFVIEQNRDGQMRSLLVNECEINPKDLIKILHYDGMPITASIIAERVREVVKQSNVTPIKRA